jgi:hypothetical protein
VPGEVGSCPGARPDRWGGDGAGGFLFQSGRDAVGAGGRDASGRSGRVTCLHSGRGVRSRGGRASSARRSGRDEGSPWRRAPAPAFAPYAFLSYGGLPCACMPRGLELCGFEPCGFAPCDRSPYAFWSCGVVPCDGLPGGGLPCGFAPSSDVVPRGGGGRRSRACEDGAPGFRGAAAVGRNRRVVISSTSPPRRLSASTFPRDRPTDRARRG